MGKTTANPGGLFSGLSARLLALTIVFVMVSEVLIFLPSIARFRADYLLAKVASAHLATLALEATPDLMVSDDLKTELLTHAGAYAIVIAKPGDVRRILASDMPPQAQAEFDLRADGPLTLVADALMALVVGEGNRVLRVTAHSPKQPGVVVQVVLAEAPMHMAMIDYAWRILALSLVISFLTASLVFLALRWMIVRPLARIGDNLGAFRDAPEDPANVIAPIGRRDEIGTLQRGLGEMEASLRKALRQKARLAALGIAVTKINHDLRNILTAARLVSDRIADSSDPKVKLMAPTLVAAIDRAVALCGQTLDYARTDLPAPQRTRFALAGLVGDAGRVVGLLTEDRARWLVKVPASLTLDADRDQMFRVLVNLGRNAAEAGARTITISATARGEQLFLTVADDGPGLPDKAREWLFQPFAGSVRSGGTGLGLAISRELVRAHGGDLVLERSDAAGTVFRIGMQGASEAAERAAE